MMTKTLSPGAKPSKYLDFDKAAQILSTLNISTVRDFEKRCREEPDFPPPGIPRAPFSVYPDFYLRGGWVAFLGTNNKKTRGRVWKSYDEAIKWVHAQKLKNMKEWVKKCQEQDWLPIDIPSNPNQVYKDSYYQKGGNGGWLGTGTISCSLRKYRSYEEAKKWACDHGFASQTQWLATRRETPHIFPPDIPSNPNTVYSDFLIKGGWGDFLGTGSWSTKKKKQERASFKEAMDWGRANGILTAKEWSSAKRPQNIPANVDVVYSKEFDEIGGWAGFLRGARNSNTSTIELVLRGVLNDIFCLEPNDRGRINIDALENKKRSLRVDWVCRNTRLIVEYDGLFFHKDKRDLDNFKTTLLTSCNPPWNVVRIRPAGLDPIASGLDILVRGRNANFTSEIISIVEGLVSFADGGKIVLPDNVRHRAQIFLTDEVARTALMVQVLRGIPISSKYMDFDKAVKILSKLKIATVRDFEKRCREEPDFPPPGIPRAPFSVYPDFNDRGGWSAFLSTENRASRGRVWKSYDEAIKWVHAQKLKNMKEWVKKCQEQNWLPIDIPSNPNQVYKDSYYQKGGSGGWLGTGTVNNKDKKFVTFEEASAWAKENGIRSAAQWFDSKNIRPSNIPSNPSVYYSSFLDVGGWEVFLGKIPSPPPSPLPRHKKRAM